MNKPNKKVTDSWRSLADKLISYGKKLGAEEVEVVITDGREINVDVRLGKVENLVEARSRHCSVRIFKEKRGASFSSSDLELSVLQRLTRNALKRAALTNPDKYSGLPQPSLFKIDYSSLKLYDQEIEKLKIQDNIKLATETERLALEDKRITNSFGASFTAYEMRTLLVNSLGFAGEYPQTYFSLSLGLQAGSGDNLVEDYWFSAKRFLHELATPEEVARKAVERTVRHLNPRKIKTQNVPVVFEPLMTSWLLGFLFSCVSGTAVYQKATFLADRLGEKIAGENITVVDDGLLPGKLGSRPFDSEGVPTQRTVVIEKGILKNFLNNTYSARKLNMHSTGNGDGYEVVPGNFYLEPGPYKPEEIVRSVKKGLYLTKTLGHGLNPVTGDISRGAFGIWIEDGELVYPVSEITIAGNLAQILQEIQMVGQDLNFESAISGPTIKVAEMTVAGL